MVRHYKKVSPERLKAANHFRMAVFDHNRLRGNVRMAQMCVNSILTSETATMAAKMWAASISRDLEYLAQEMKERDPDFEQRRAALKDSP